MPDLINLLFENREWHSFIFQRGKLEFNNGSPVIKSWMASLLIKIYVYVRTEQHKTAQISWNASFSGNKEFHKVLSNLIFKFRLSTDCLNNSVSGNPNDSAI